MSLGTVFGQTRTLLSCRVTVGAAPTLPSVRVDEGPGLPAFLAEPLSPQNSWPNRARGFQTY